MSFLEIAQKRFSCRSYENKPVEKEKIMQIMEAARIAPSANNKQPWKFFVISEDKKFLEKVHETYHRDWFNEAPVVIVCCANNVESWKRSYDNKNHAEIDTTIAIDHITLAATDLGLATCWICNFHIDKVIELFNLPDNLTPIALIPVAYCKTKPDLNRFDKKRKNIKDIVEFL